MKKTLALSLAILLLAMVALAACGSEANDAQTTPPPSPPAQATSVLAPAPSPAASPSPSPEPEPDPSVTATDILGRTITLPQPALRVVGTHNPTMNMAVIIGGGGQYIAGFGNKNMAIGLYDFVFPELRDDVLQIGMGQEINFETVLAVGADLAIVPERFASLIDQFEEIGVPTAVLLPVDQGFDSITNAISILGALLNEQERAVAINAFFESKIEAAQAVAAQITDQPRVMFTGGSAPTRVAHRRMLQSVMMETVGAINVARDIDHGGDFADVSLEEIIAWNPEVIYVPTYASYTVDDILNDPAWVSVQAVMDGRVYEFPSQLDPWDYPTPSTSMGLVWLMHNLYPELYTMEQVMRDANEFYQLVYGQTFTAEQLGIR